MQDLSSTRAVPNGACGYGSLSAKDFPGFMLAGVSFVQSPVAKSAAMKGCGSCLEVKCTDKQVCTMLWSFSRLGAISLSV